ncbi:MAG TPA: DUF58 domain-containing protein [Actinomycetota bacterium]|nr:DUF58 domain-containing protein [Actinomycetota bacterium]
MISAAGARSGLGPRGFLAWAERRLGLTSSGVILVALSLVGLLAARLIGSRPMYFLVYGALSLLAAAWLSGRRGLGAAAERSELPLRIREGQSAGVQVTLTAKRRLSTVVLEESLPPLLGPPVRVPVPVLGSGQSLEYPYAVSPRLRGVYDIGPLDAIWSDPFGLTRRRMRLIEPVRVIVHPSVESVHDRVLSREWEDPPIRPPVSKPWPSGFEFYGMRDYVAGDDPRRIVWRAVARTGRYLVREAEQGITDRVTLIVDTDAARHSPGEPSETLEAAVRAGAALGARHLKDGFAVTVETGDGRTADSLRGTSRRIPFLDEMARIQRGRTPLAEALTRLLANPRRDTHHMVVTPHLDPQSGVILQALLGRGGSVLLVHVIHEDSDPDSALRAAALGCEVVELRPSDPLEAVFRRSVGAGLRR